MQPAPAISAELAFTLVHVDIRLLRQRVDDSQLDPLRAFISAPLSHPEVKAPTCASDMKLVISLVREPPKSKLDRQQRSYATCALIGV